MSVGRKPFGTVTILSHTPILSHNDETTWERSFALVSKSVIGVYMEEVTLMS